VVTWPSICPQARRLKFLGAGRDYEDGFTAEREWQAAWLVERLGL
jgi:hypothetical protein